MWRSPFMSAIASPPTWIKFTITSDESKVFVSVRGSRGERLPNRTLGISRDVLEKFANDVERVAACGQPLGDKVLADAQAIQQALLNAESGAHFGRLCEAAGGSLFVRFVVEDPTLRAVPWEALCKADESLGFWGTSTNVFPVRGAFSSDPWQPVEVSGAIKVLAVAPTGSAGLENLKLALAESIDRGQVQWLDPLTGPVTKILAIFDRLRQIPAPGVLHFLGHIRLAAPNRPELQMADDDGEETWIAAEVFAQQLKAQFGNHLRLIVLEACEGANPGVFASAAEILAQNGEAAVVAHLWPVRANVAQTFSTQFYRALTDAHRRAGDVAFAANEARRAVLAAYNRSAQALSLVVVLRGTSGKIFHFERRDMIVRPSTTLPPIVERLPKGEEGAEEFGHLIYRLIHASPENPSDAAFGRWLLRRREGNIDILSWYVPLGPSPSSYVLWSPNDIRVDIGSEAMIHVLHDLFSAYEQDSEVSVPVKVEFSLWFPRELSQDEFEWLQSLPREKVVHPQVRGLSHLEKLLRANPTVFARYYPELASKELPELDPCFDYRAFTTHYCEEIVRDKEHVNLLGFPPEALRERDAKANIRLADLFVPTVFRAQQNREHRTVLSDLLNVGTLGAEQSVLVLGDPGMGKTMLLSFIALLHARGVVQVANYTPPSRRIPLFVSLREYALAEQEARKDQRNLSLLDYLAQHYKTKRNLGSAHPAFFEAALRMGEAIVLLDGLDEVGSSVARQRVAARVRDLRREYPFCPIWVASRIHGYTHDIALPSNEFEHVMIGALDDAQIDDFLSRWYAIQVPHDAQKQAEQRNSLRQAIFRTKQVEALARNPLLLTLMAFVHRFLGHLPQDRGELYDKCVEMLLRSWLEARERPQKHAFEELALPRELPRDYLEALAFHLQERGLLVNDEATEARGLFSRDDALAFLSKHHLKSDRRSPAISPSKAQIEMRDFIDYACDRVGLLADRGGGKLSFLHLSFQEYLAAAHETLATRVDVQQTIFAKHFRDASWSEVLLLRLYLFAQKRGAEGRDILDNLVSAMIDDVSRTDSITAWLLLGRALRDRHNLRPEHRKTILERLVYAWAKNPVFEGDAFVALDDILVFAKDEVKGELRLACTQVQAAGSPGEAIAALYLEEKFFGRVDGAAKRFAARTDVMDVLADLVAFHDVPEMAALLSEKSTPDHWEMAFDGLNCEYVYRRTLAWAMNVNPCPLRTDAPLLGAVRSLRRTINAEVHSREVFAQRYHDHNNAILFRQPGTLRNEGEFHKLDAPLAFAMTYSKFKSNVANAIFKRSAFRDLANDRFNADSVGSSLEIESNLETTFGRIIASVIHTLDAGQVIDRREIARWFASDFVGEFDMVLYFNFATPFGGIWAVRNHKSRGGIAKKIALWGRTFASASHCHLVHNAAAKAVAATGRQLGHGFAAILLDALGFNASDLADRMLKTWFFPQTPVKASLLVTRETFHLSYHIESYVAIPGLLADICTVMAMNRLFALGRHMHVLFPDGEVLPEAWHDWLAKHPMFSFWSALAWNEHAKLFRQNHGKLDGAHGALMLAHADYASMMTGIDLENAEQYPYWKALVDEAGPEKIHALRHYAPALAPTPAGSPAPIPTPAPAIVREPAPLFTFLHISDLHFGLPKPGDRHNQTTILTALRDEFANLASKSLPQPEAIFVTGDIAYAGKTTDYEQASKWLDEILRTLGLTHDRVYVVPGNHDVNREVDADRKVNRLMRLLRDGDDVDDALADQDDRDLLLRRKDAYLELAKRFAPACQFPNKLPFDRLVWTHQFKTRSDLSVHIVGLDTALLAADNDDPKKLRLGQTQIARLNQMAPGEELVIVLGHHPLNKEWLHPEDERDLSVLLRRRAHLYLAGHVHDHDSEHVISGGGSEFVRLIAGATYGGRQHDIPQGHAYSIGTVLPAFEDKPIRLRIYPRRFSFKNGDFRTDTDNVKEGKTFAEFELKDLKV